MVAISPMPSPVASAVRSHISWTAAISGKVRRATHNSDRPYCAPVWEYVAIPEGSSSDDPVTNPGPIDFRYSRQIGPAGVGVVLSFTRDLRCVMKGAS